MRERDDSRLKLSDVRRNIIEVLAYAKEIYNYELLKVKVKAIDNRHVKVIATFRMPYEVRR